MAKTELTTDNHSRRIAALERAILELTDALLKKGTEQDGNWGHESFGARMSSLHDQFTTPSPPK